MKDVNQTMENFSARPKDLGAEMAAAIPKNLQEAFTRVVKAGMKVMFSEQTHDMMMEQLSQDGELPQVLGEGIAGLMLILYKKSNETMPPEIIIPSGIYLLSEGADFMETIMGEEMPPDIIADAVEVMTSILMEKFGIKKENFNMAMEKAAAGGYEWRD